MNPEVWMRTTVDIPDEVYRKLKAKAAMEGSSVKELVLRMVNRELTQPDRTETDELPIIRGTQGRKISISREDINEALFG
jgi:predicted CopG family antitoxin